MKTKLFSIGAALAVALAGNVLQAQDPSGAASQGPAATSDPGDPSAVLQSSGTLGQTYISVDTSLLHFQDIADSPNAIGTDFGINLPMTDHFDYTFGYGFGDSRSHDFNFTDNNVGNSVTAFYKFGHISPYASAGVSYEWERLTSGITQVGLPTRFDRLDYDVGAGMEFPISAEASLRAGIGDDDSSIRPPRSRDWDYELRANYWLGSVVGTFAGAELRNGRGGALNEAEFTVGLRFLLGSN